MEELTKDLMRKLLNARMAEGKATDKDEKAKLVRNSIDIQLEMSRRSQDLKKLKADIALLEGDKRAPVQSAGGTAAAPPIIPKAIPQTSSPNFDVADNVGLLGVEIRSLRAPNPIACREACESDSACVGFQHGRKNPVMGTCELFSRIDARREDDQWRSGLKKEGVGGTR